MIYDNKIPSTSLAVWVATALLHRENQKEEAFRTKTIYQKIKDEKLIDTAYNTIIAHITVHCVANSKPNPNKHRRIYRAGPGLYRLYKDTDDYHHLREGGKSVPTSSEIPIKYRELLDWYASEYNTRSRSISPTDPSHYTKYSTSGHSPQPEIGDVPSIPTWSTVVDGVNDRRGKTSGDIPPIPRRSIGLKSKRTKSTDFIFTSVREKGMVKIPINILERLELKPDDYLVFIENSNGEIILKKAIYRYDG